MLTANAQSLPNSLFLRTYCLPVRASIFFPRVNKPTRVLGSRSLKMLSQTLEMTLTPEFDKSSIKDNSSSNTYDRAMEALSSLITSRKRGENSRISIKIGKLQRMDLYIKILGLESQISKLKIIHVAGTKGKGSTCSFCEAILRNCGFRTGLFTSPHLVDVRERFRINGEDISEEKFLSYFWDCWDTLKENVTEQLPMPPLFQFLTVLACKIFSCEQVDVVILEVGLGGRKDSTNFITEPVVCGITSLGMDHVEALGGTLSSIASHKAGIFKPNVPAFTAPQLPEAMDALFSRANELQIDLTVADPLNRDVKLSLAGDHQYINASLAVSLCKSWLKRTGNWEKLIQNENEMPEAFYRGLSTTCLSGRGQIVHESFSNFESDTKIPGGKLTFYLDGAHSPESIDACGKWFSSSLRINDDSASQIQVIISQSLLFDNRYPSLQILVFNCMDVRDPQLLLSRLVNICAASRISFTKAIFVPSISSYNQVTSGHSSLPSDFSSKDLTWQLSLQKIWGQLVHRNDDSSTVYRDTSPSPNFLLEDGSVVFSSLPLVIKWLKDCSVENPSAHIQVLVTGSLHLVGDVLKILGK